MEMEEAINALEQRELEHGPDGIRAEGYTELLAYYLLQGELCNAKFLWKRVPSTLKSQCPEIEAVWNVGRRLWSKDMEGFYQALRSFQWSPTVAPIISQLTESVREKTVNLIGTAYSSIRPQDVSILLGLPLREVENLVNSKPGWEIADGMILPKECPPKEVSIGGGEEQIGKLTDYVAFLEN